MTHATERWLPVVGYEGYYEVSSRGRVRSLDRTIEKRNRWGSITTCTLSSCLLTPIPEKAYVGVKLARHGHVRTVRIHTLVLEAFHGPCPEGHQALHDDGDGQNNDESNLQWGTPAQNSWDKIRHGTHHYARRDLCRQGHRYAGPNLVARSDSGRRCRSCMHAKDFPAEERQQVSDNYYEQIMRKC